MKAEVCPEREPKGDIRPISNQPVMASLYILILMTPTAKLRLSLQQVPQPLSSLEKRRSTPTMQQDRWAIKAADEKDEGREEEGGETERES